MPWLLTSPGHQQPWYWLHRVCRPFSCLRKDFKYLCQINVEEWHKMQIHVYIPSEKFSKGLSMSETGTVFAWISNCILKNDAGCNYLFIPYSPVSGTHIYSYMLHWWICCFFNTLKPRQNGCRFPDEIFKWIFLNENVSISIDISLKFVPNGPINNIPALA